MSENTRFLVTGASGFIGRQVVAHLVGHGLVHAISRSQRNANDPAVTWHQVDFHDEVMMERLIRQVRPTHLVHLSWVTAHGDFWSSPHNAKWANSSLAVTRSFARSGGCRVVVAGTCAEYDSAAPSPLHELLSPINPATQYGLMKNVSRLGIEALAAEYGFSFAWARIFHVFGPYENPKRLVPSIILSLLSGKPAMCTSGVQRRDFMDVRDLGRAVAGLATSDFTGPINLGSGMVTTIASLAETVGEAMGRNDLIRLGAIPDRWDEPLELFPSVERMRRELGFFPAIDLREGLKDAAFWWSTQAMRKEPSSGNQMAR